MKLKAMAALSGTSTVSLEDNAYWQADKRLLPRHLRTSDNARRVLHYKTALRNAMKSRLSEKEREHLRLFYEKRMTKTNIGKLYGVGSSTVCKTIKSAEEKIREYVELYMQIYGLLENEDFNEYDEASEICGGQAYYAKHSVDNRRI